MLRELPRAVGSICGGRVAFGRDEHHPRLACVDSGPPESAADVGKFSRVA